MVDPVFIPPVFDVAVRADVFDSDGFSRSAESYHQQYFEMLWYVKRFLKGVAFD